MEKYHLRERVNIKTNTGGAIGTPHHYSHSASPCIRFDVTRRYKTIENFQHISRQNYGKPTYVYILSSCVSEIHVSVTGVWSQSI